MYPKYDHPYGFEDLVFAVKGLFRDYSKELETELKTKLGFGEVILMDSGRSCLSLILDSLKFPRYTKIAVPVNTCRVVVDTILSKNLKPVFIDVTRNLTMSPKDLERKITPRTKAIIPVYTYGNKYNTKAISKIAKKNKAIIIEDLAQTFIKTSPFAVAGFISLDITKHISCFGGGLLLANNLKISTDKIKKRKLGFENIFKIVLFKFLTNNTIYGLLTNHIARKIKRLYYYKPKLRRLSKVGTALAFSQVRKLNQINKVRKNNAYRFIKSFDKDRVYSNKNSTFLFVAINSNSKDITKIIDLPSPVPLLNQLEIYRPYFSSCPKAEKIQKNLLLLPTYFKINKIIDKLYTLL